MVFRYHHLLELGIDLDVDVGNLLAHLDLILNGRLIRELVSFVIVQNHLLLQAERSLLVMGALVAAVLGHSAFVVVVVDIRLAQTTAGGLVHELRRVAAPLSLSDVDARSQLGIDEALPQS